jgi:hypothetical protein
MTEHLHSTFVPGCYRCDLSRDELIAVEAERAEETRDWDAVYVRNRPRVRRQG